MSCTVVVGGQFGSEGKGKVTALVSSTLSKPWVVRCGGPNSGHTSSFNGKETVLRQLPSGIGYNGAKALIPAGAIVDEQLLLNEIRSLNIQKEQVIVDPRAILLLDVDRDWEKANLRHISSTCSGTGAATIRRLTRPKNLALAGDSKILDTCVRLEPIAPLIHDYLDNGGDVILEGSQGFGLSLYHGYEFPFVTSRDTTASGFIMEVGLSPKQVDSIIMVIRTNPIRTGKNGTLPNETTFEEIQSLSCAPKTYYEKASVTNRPRRVGFFDVNAVKQACMYNRPSYLAIMGMDRLDNKNYGIKDFSKLSEKALSFIEYVEEETNVPVILVGTGFDSKEAIWIPK